MDLDETRTLLALAEEGSVSGAAERMGVSRATVRRRLAALEARVGVSLARKMKQVTAPCLRRYQLAEK